MNSLKQCPFCGGEKIKLYTGVNNDKKSYARVYCEDCGVSTKSIIDIKNDGSFISEAVKAWNTRKEDQQEQQNQDNELKK